MLNGQIESELAEVEPCCLRQQSVTTPDLQQLIDQEQGVQDIHCYETLLHDTEHFRRSSSTWLGIIGATVSSLRQLFSHYPARHRWTCNKR